MNIPFLRPLSALALLLDPHAQAAVEIVDVQPTGAVQRVAYATDQDNHYYVLRRGDTIAAIGSAVDLRIAQRGTNVLEAAGQAVTGFYRVDRVPLSSPVDSDGDGFNDLLELGFQPDRSPVFAFDGPVVPPCAPDALPDLTTNDTLVVTGRGWPGSTLRVAGGLSPATAAVDGAGNFSVPVSLLPNRLNRLFLTSESAGATSVPLVRTVIHDRQAPSLAVDIPADREVTIESTVTLAGRVSDALAGSAGLTVTVNGLAAAVLPGPGQTATFERSGLALALGSNTFQVVATDRLGNARSLTHTVIRRAPGTYRLERVSGDAQTAQAGAALPLPATVRVLDGNGSPFAGKAVRFRLARGDGQLRSGPSASLPASRDAVVRTDASGLARAWWTLGSAAGCAEDRLEVSSPGIDGLLRFTATTLPGAARRINIGDGQNQVTEAGALLPRPLRVWVNDSRNGVGNVPVTFRVHQGGGSVDGATSAVVVTDPTGHAEVPFRLGRAPGVNRVEASFAGLAGKPAVFIATGVQRDPARPTRFSGRVLDNINQPLGGATAWLYLNGQALPSVLTDSNGFFTVENVPAGGGYLFIEGRTANLLGGQPLSLGSFPGLTREVLTVANVDNQFPGPILLPRLNPANVVFFDNQTDALLICAGIEGLQFRVRAGSMRMPDGSSPSSLHPEMLSLNQVQFDNLPMPVPDGGAPSFAWTLQPPGATFDPPIEITAPNMAGLPPGTATQILTYNHAIEQFQAVGTGRVTDDGASVVSDPGSGLTLSGWGVGVPPSTTTGNAYKCLPSVNGCGAAWMGGGNVFTDCAISGAALPFGPNPFCFTGPCNIHDICYGILGSSKAACDSAFYQQMRDVCTVTYGSAYPVAKAQCGLRASMLYNLVNSFGQVAYDQAQADTRACLGIPALGGGGPPPLAGLPQSGPIEYPLPPPYADDDADGIDDDWEAQHGLDPANPYDGSLDPDQDGLNNLVEFTLDSDPQNPDVDGNHVPDGDQLFAVQPPPTGLDSTWSLRIAGQPVVADNYGRFFASNITVPDTRGPQGSGGDGVSDTWVWLEGSRTLHGTTHYVWSERFRIRADDDVEITEDMLTYSPVPLDTLERLDITAPATLLSALGQQAQLTVTGTRADGSTVEVSTFADFTDFTSSNPRVITVSSDGVVTAVGEGSAYVTAVNFANSAVFQFQVSPGAPTGAAEGYVRLPDGTPGVGVSVTAGSLPGSVLTDSRGRFLFPVIPLDDPSLAFNASLVGGGSNLFGSVVVPPNLRSGTNDVGIILLSQPAVPPGMVLIAPGEFTMGDTFGESYSFERPAHPAHVDAFAIDATEVTLGLWQEVHQWAISHGYAFDHAGAGRATNHPVHSVSWYDAVKWCNARSEKEGLPPRYFTDTSHAAPYRTGAVDLVIGNVDWSGTGYRLPTEAEWEKAARGGFAGRRFPWGDTITHSNANYYSSAFYAIDVSPTGDFHPDYDIDPEPYTSPVGAFPANGFGLRDMVGNVREWCWDLYGDGYYHSSPYQNPRGELFGIARAQRDGAWSYGPIACRVSYRETSHPSVAANHVGFRCVR